MQSYVNGFMFSEDKKKVALIKKNKPSWQKGLLNGIGGKIEKDETPQMAIVREFEEETGVKTKISDWKLFVIINKDLEYKLYFFVAINNKIFDIKTMEEEEVGIYDTNNLPQKKLFNLNWLIPMSLDSHLNLEEPIKIKH